jgi:hypothetical protein
MLSREGHEEGSKAKASQLNIEAALFGGVGGVEREEAFRVGSPGGRGFPWDWLQVSPPSPAKGQSLPLRRQYGHQ